MKDNDPTYLDEVGFEFPVKHDIKPQNFEAAAALDMIREAGSVVVFEDGVGRNHRLDDDVIYIPPNFIQIVTVISPPTVDGGDSSGKELIVIT